MPTDGRRVIEEKKEKGGPSHPFFKFFLPLGYERIQCHKTACVSAVPSCIRTRSVQCVN